MTAKNKKPDNLCLTAAEAAAVLGVSGATVRNWRRAGHLRAESEKPLLFTRKEVLELKERIRTNHFNRLRSRANKSASDKFHAAEAASARTNADLAALTSLVHHRRCGAGRVLFLAALHVLRQAGETGALPRDGEWVDVDDVAWRRNAVRETMRGWLRRLGGRVRSMDDPALTRFAAGGRDDDCLGLLYQQLSSEGRKSRTGAYFTPGEVIDDSLAALDPTVTSFLDPCCGTGRYLLRAAARFGLAPENLHGFDSDPAAVDIARINLLLHYRDLEHSPEVHCLDSLKDLANGAPGCRTNVLLDAVDAVATNPPWGGGKNRQSNAAGDRLQTGETFALFLEKSLRLVRSGGQLSFVLPESVLKVKAHAAIRRLLLAETRIRRITMLGRVFPGVFTPIVRLDVEKAPASRTWRVAVVGVGRQHSAPQRRFADNVGHTFDVAVTPGDEALLAKIYRVEHTTLAGRAEWALGIVTGDNARSVLDAPAKGTEPVLRGRDVFAYVPAEPCCHIRFRPEAFQQVAPERFFRAPEKLVYRFVSDRLVFAYDDQQRLTLNSANILIPRLPGISLRAALAFLNSQVFQYVFAKRFGTRKILRSDLETLPFPLLSTTKARRIEAAVKDCLAGRRGAGQRVDKAVNALFGLKDSDIRRIEENVR